MKSYQYIFFDWDGCLANSLGMWFDAIKSSLDKYNLTYSDSDIVAMFGDLYNNSLRLGLKKEDFLTFKKMVYSNMDMLCEKVTLYEGAESILRELKSDGKRLALISSGSKNSLEKMLSVTGVDDCFEFVVSGSDVERRKPHPEGIDMALAKLGSKKESTIMVGDSEHDLMAASAAGIDSILFYPDSHKLFYDLEGLRKLNPTYTIKKFEELKELLDSEEN